MHQRFRRHRQHDHGCDRERAKRNGAAVDHDRDQHHGRHEERALRRDFRARQQQIERRRNEGCRSRPFLDGVANRERRKQRQQRPHREEHDAGDDCHMIARDRQHMAEAGDEHRIVHRRRDRVAPPGQQRGGDRALVAFQRGPDPRIDRIPQALHERRVAQAKPAAVGRLRRLDRAHHEAGGADAGEKHVAAEIVAARPQWRKRRQQPRLQLDEAADRGRRALLHRQPHALELCRSARAFHGDDAQHKTVGALANVAGFDKTRQRHRKHRPRQHAMRDPRRLPRRHRKSRRDRGDHDRDRKELLPPQQNRDCAKPDRNDGGHRQNRLMIGSKIESDAGAERDRHPGQQTARRRLQRVPIGAASRSDGGQKAGRDGARPPAGAAARGGQVPA